MKFFLNIVEFHCFIAYKYNVHYKKIKGEICMKKLVLLFVLLISTVFATASKTYMDIGVDDAYKLTMESKEIIIVDVSPLYAKGHIPGAINAYVGDGTLDKELKKWDMKKTYLVYCHSDSASMLGAQKLVDAGFKVVYRLKGNYGAWVDAGYPTDK